MQRLHASLNSSKTVDLFIRPLQNAHIAMYSYFKKERAKNKANSIRAVLTIKTSPPHVKFCPAILLRFQIHIQAIEQRYMKHFHSQISEILRINPAHNFRASQKLLPSSYRHFSAYRCPYTHNQPGACCLSAKFLRGLTGRNACSLCLEISFC